MHVDCQTLDPHSAGASDDPLAARPAVIAVLAGFRCFSSRDTALVPFRVAHHHPPLTVLLDTTDGRCTGLCELGDLRLPCLVRLAGAEVEVESILHALLFRDPEEQHPRA